MTRATVYCSRPDDPDYRRSVSGIGAQGVDFSFLPAGGASRTLKTKTAGTLVLFDAEDFSPRKILELGGKCPQPWGVIDRKGAVGDPAALFHAGAADYFGPALFVGGGALDAGREAKARSLDAAFRSAASSSPSQAASCGETRASPAFPGWGALKAETCYPFVFLYAALGDQPELGKRIGEKRMDKLREDFSLLMEAWAEELGGKLWIRDAVSNLLLFPAAADNSRLVPDLIKFQLDRILIGYERFRLEVPVRFRFALHAGEAPWRRPGSTGTVVSEHVNYIYHLGMKAVSDGTTGISDEAFNLIPASFADFFKDGSAFENRGVKHSRSFAWQAGAYARK